MRYNDVQAQPNRYQQPSRRPSRDERQYPFVSNRAQVSGLNSQHPEYDVRGHYSSRQDQRPDSRTIRNAHQHSLQNRSSQNHDHEPHRLCRSHPATESLRSDSESGSSKLFQDTEQQIISKRQQKVAQIAEEHGDKVEVGADFKPKGLVRQQRIGKSGIQLLWRENDRDDWQRAVYHYQLRSKYINQQHPLDGFDVRRPRGHEDTDVTTFFELWRHWRPTRKDGWSGIQADVLFCFDRGDYPKPDYNPGYLMDEGRIVLDLDNHPVKDWRELPLCLSSHLDGSNIETVRRINQNLTMMDIRARMPKFVLTGPTKNTVTPLFKISALGNRANDFHERNACPSWVVRGASHRFRNFIWSLMSREQRDANTTEGLSMLTDLQLAEFSIQAAGKSLNKAGSRALPPEERDRRNAAKAEKLLELRRKAGAQQERPHQQRKRDFVPDDRPKSTSISLGLFHIPLIVARSKTQASTLLGTMGISQRPRTVPLFLEIGATKPHCPTNLLSSLGSRMDLTLISSKMNLKVSITCPTHPKILAQL